MRFHPALLAAGIALSRVSDAAETSAPDANAPLSLIRQYLRDSIEVPPLAKPVEPAAKPEPKSPDTPVMLPAFHVTERSLGPAVNRVNALSEPKDHPQSHALYESAGVTILQPPTLERGPAGLARLRLNIFQLKF